MNNNKPHKYTLQRYFTWKPNAGENHQILFLYIKRIHSLEAPNSDSLAATGRRLQPPSFSGYNLKETPTPQLFGSNQKDDKIERWLQPPILAPSNRPAIKM